jgi:hypothetical protein
MSSVLFRRSILFPVIIIAAGCVEEYAVIPDYQSDGIIVVDTYLNATTRSARVYLSYPYEAGQDTITQVETGATVLIESDTGPAFALHEVLPGRYEGDNLPVDMSSHYRLHFTTRDQREFASDFVPVTRSPPIDSVTWDYHAPEAGKHGINIIVTTTGQNDEGLNFLWDFEETWEYTADYYSEYKYVNREAVRRTYDEYVYFCYKTARSPKILLGSTEMLTSDIVRNHPLVWIEGGSQRLDNKYSILVSQRTITKGEHRYWSKVKATTEDLGELFDPPLGQVQGNIRNIDDPRAPIVGFFSAGEVTEKRLFIVFNELPMNVLALRRKGLCDGEDRRFIPLDEMHLLTKEQVPVSAQYTLTGVLLGYEVSTRQCADCRWQGGVSTPPSFW